MKGAKVLGFGLSYRYRKVAREEPFSVIDLQVIGDEGFVGLMMPAVDIGEERNARWVCL